VSLAQEINGFLGGRLLPSGRYAADLTIGQPPALVVAFVRRTLLRGYNAMAWRFRSAAIGEMNFSLEQWTWVHGFTLSLALSSNNGGDDFMDDKRTHNFHA
jgi:hypothetical protein